MFNDVVGLNKIVKYMTNQCNWTVILINFFPAFLFQNLKYSFRCVGGSNVYPFKTIIWPVM
jgi:hypothetical protein